MFHYSKYITYISFFESMICLFGFRWYRHEYANRYYRSGNDDNGVPYRFQTIDDYNKNGYTGIDWQNEAFRPTWSQNHDVSISGGTKDTKYTISFSHFDENGIFKNSGYQKTTARAKLTQNIFK